MFLYSENLTEDITAAFVHEVKNPVSLIKANIELLELDETFDKYEKNIKVIKKELNKIASIVTGFMTLCKTSYKNEIEYIDVFYLLKDIVQDFAISNSRNIKFEFDCFTDIEDMNVMGEHLKLYMLFSNIYKNAIEAIKQASGVIKTSIYKRDELLYIDIIDNGEGIKEDIKDKLYSPFVTNKEGGSGLGIMICRNIVNEIDGDFVLFNNNDCGCTARVIFKYINN